MQMLAIAIAFACIYDDCSPSAGGNNKNIIGGVKRLNMKLAAGDVPLGIEDVQDVLRDMAANMAIDDSIESDTKLRKLIIEWSAALATLSKKEELSDSLSVANK